MNEEIALFEPPIPPSLRPESLSEVFGINGLDLHALAGDLNMIQFIAIGKWVQISAAASPWWEGDWGNYGELKFSDDYYQAIEIEWSDSTEHARRRVTAASFDYHERRPELSFAHHQVVVSKIRKGVDIKAERQAWLTKAIEEKLTAPQLAKAIREAQAIDVGEVQEEAPEPPRDPVTFTTFTISITVPVGDAETAEPIMERGETALKAELQMAGVEVSSTNRRRKG